MIKIYDNKLKLKTFICSIILFGVLFSMIFMNNLIVISSNSSDLKKNDNSVDHITPNEISYVNTPNSASQFHFATNQSLGGVGISYTHISSGDLDLDGDIDLLYGNIDDQVVIMENDGTPWGSWDYYIIGTMSNIIASVITVDLDNDGDLDIVSLDSDHYVHIWKNNGNVWESDWDIPNKERHYNLGNIGSHGKYLKADDFDGDGDMDILSGGWTDDIYLITNDGTPWDSSWVSNSIVINAGALGIGLGDFDNDLDTDIVYTRTSISLDIARNDGVPWSTWSEYIIGDPGNSGSGNDVLCFDTYDFDGNGYLDVVTGCQDNNITLWFNDGTPFAGAWSSQNIASLDYFVMDVKVCDLDMDGVSEIISRDTQQELRIWKNNSGVWTYQTIYTASTGSPISSTILTEDLDSDGDLDIIIWDYSNFYAFKNLNPSLSAGKVYPEYGNSDTSFNYSVVYDSYENVDVNVKVVIDGTSYTMQKVIPNDFNYRDGVLFYILLNGLEQETHTFRFTANSTENIESTGDIENHYGPIIYSGSQSPYDYDGDGILNTIDQFPLNPNEWLDTDLDGIGDNSDTDDDNDGVLDTNDAFPMDSNEVSDFDMDGIGDNSDTDDDNDGVIDAEDAFPYDSTRSTQDIIPDEWTFSEILIIGIVISLIMGVFSLIGKTLNLMASKNNLKSKLAQELELPESRNIEKKNEPKSQSKQKKTNR